MSLIIKFSRIGKKGESKFRVIIKEKRSKRNGKAVETLGYCEIPKGKKITKQIDGKRLKYWLEHGAIPTDSVRKVI